MSFDLTPLLSKGVNEHVMWENMRDDFTFQRIFHVVRTDSPYLDDVTWEMYNAPAVTPPMTPVHMGSFQPSFTKRYIMVKYTLGDAIPREYWEWDQYGVISRVVPSRSGAIARSFAVRRERAAADYIGVIGFTTTTPAPGSPDSKPLFAVDHPISLSNPGVTASNRPSTDVDLSHTSYNTAAANLLQQMAPNNYEILNNRPRYLVCNPNIRHVAYQIAQGNWERGTSNFNMNVGVRDDLEVILWPYFRVSGSTGTWNGWFVQGEYHFLKYVIDKDFEAESDYDINIQAYIFVAYCRDDVGHTDWRGMYGSKGA